MTHPLVTRPEAEVTLAPALLAPVGYWAVLTSAGRPRVALDMPWDKRWKAAHRYTVADVNGPLSLTVPIASKGATGKAWGEVGVSRHGRWEEVHREALASAYGRTPFFEHYAPRLLRWLTPDACATVGELVKRTNGEILGILGLPGDFIGYGGAGRPLKTWPAAEVPYWQVRAGKLGFLPSLSIMDLVFSLGPEAGPYLQGLAADCAFGQ